MKRLLISAAAIAAFSASTTAFAAPITDGWSGEASVSGSTTSGNTSTTDIGLALHLAKESGPWKNKFDATYDLGKSNGADNKNRMFLGYQLDRQINDRLYGYGNVNYFNDDFGAFKDGYFVGAGLGYNVLVDEPVIWDIEAGAGYRNQQTQAGVENSEFALRGGSQFKYQFSEAVSLYNNSEVIWSDSNTNLWNDIGVTANLTGNLAARFSFRVDHNTDVPLGFEKTDTITRGALVYTLK